MSASLVGSEMCIRDRGTTERARWGPPRQRQRRGPASAPPRRRAGSRRPVSYTHLTLPTICSV
eukprot:3620666-Alexandrium_andersonii.AAC.1